MEYIVEDWLVDTVTALSNQRRKEASISYPAISWYDARDIVDAVLRIGVYLKAESKKSKEEIK